MDIKFLNFNFLPFISIFILIIFSAAWFKLSFYIYKKKPKAGLVLLCFLSVLFIYFSYCRLLDDIFYFTPKIDTTFNEVITKSKWPFTADVISIKDHEYIEIVLSPGAIQSLIRLTSLRSGMPAYIFDIEGNLIDFTIDNYDDPEYQEKWEAPEKRKRISVDVAYSLFIN